MAARKGGKFPSHSSKAPCPARRDSDEDASRSTSRQAQFAAKAPREMPKRRCVSESEEEDMDDEGEEGGEGVGDGSADGGGARSSSPTSPGAGPQSYGEEEGEEEQAPSADGEESEGRDVKSLLPKLQHQMAKVTKQKDKIKSLEQEVEKERKKAAQLTAQVQAMTRVDVAQKREMERLRAKSGECEDGTNLPFNQGRKKKKGSTEAEADEADPKRPRAQHGPMRSLRAASAQDPNDFGLALILPENMGTVDVPHSYKGGDFHFPHRVQAAKSGLRQYVIESRNLVYIACQLRNVALYRNATEMELPAKGDVMFKIEVFLASGGPALTTADFRTPIENLMDPPESNIGSVRMSHGMVKWRFHCKFLSRATKPTPNQEFVLRMTCTNPELASFPIGAETPPFAVVSREIKHKAA